MAGSVLFNAQAPVFDRSALDGIVEIFGSDDPTAIVDLLDTFLTESAKQCAEMRTSFDSGDWTTLHRMAHSLKSSSATFGAMRLASASAALESAAKTGCSGGQCLEQLVHVEEEHQVACAILAQERASFAGV